MAYPFARGLRFHHHLDVGRASPSIDLASPAIDHPPASRGVDDGVVTPCSTANREVVDGHAADDHADVGGGRATDDRVDQCCVGGGTIDGGGAHAANGLADGGGADADVNRAFGVGYGRGVDHVDDRKVVDLVEDHGDYVEDVRLYTAL